MHVYPMGRRIEAPAYPGCSGKMNDPLTDLENAIVTKHLTPLVVAARSRGIPIGLAGDCGSNDLAIRLRALGRNVVQLERDAHVSEGYNRRRSDIFELNDPQLNAKFQGFVSEAELLLARDMEIIEAGDDPEMPSGDFVEIHPLVGHVLLRGGAYARQILMYKQDGQGRVERNEYGLVMRRVTTDGGIRMTHHLRHRIVQCSVTMTDGADGLALSHQPGRLLLTVPGVEFPATVITGMRGMMLADVVKHPLLEGAPDLRIERATMWSGNVLSLTIEQAKVAVTDAWNP